MFGFLFIPSPSTLRSEGNQFLPCLDYILYSCLSIFATDKDDDQSVRSKEIWRGTYIWLMYYLRTLTPKYNQLLQLAFYIHFRQLSLLLNNNVQSRTNRKWLCCPDQGSRSGVDKSPTRAPDPLAFACENFIMIKAYLSWLVLRFMPQ